MTKNTKKTTMPRDKYPHKKINAVWEMMRYRVSNANNPSTYYYSGEPVIISQEWNDPNDFYNWAVCNGYENNHTLERIGNKGDFTPENCKWVLWDEEIYNREVLRLRAYIKKSNNEEKEDKEYKLKLENKVDGLMALNRILMMKQGRAAIRALQDLGLIQWTIPEIEIVQKISGSKA